jgi:hypothetical protein
MPHLTGGGHVVRAYVSLACVQQLIDGVKYLTEVPPQESRDLRRMRRRLLTPNARCVVAWLGTGEPCRRIR